MKDDYHVHKWGICSFHQWLDFITMCMSTSTSISDKSSLYIIKSHNNRPFDIVLLCCWFLCRYCATIEKCNSTFKHMATRRIMHVTSLSNSNFPYLFLVIPNQEIDTDSFYSTKSSLKQHSKFECDKEPMFHCNICSYKTKVKSNINRHMRFVHSKHHQIEFAFDLYW